MDDVLVVVLAYVAIPYWLLVLPWYGLSRWLNLRMGKWARASWVCAAPIVAYVGVWWGGVGFGLALLVIGVFGQQLSGRRDEGL